MNFLIISTFFIVPIIMIGIGILWRKGGPKKINGLYGYRTTRSMASQEAWDFAHIYSGKVFLIMGIFQFILTVLAGIYYWPKDDTVVGIATIVVLTIQTLLLVLTIPITEFKLKKKFDENGKKI